MTPDGTAKVSDFGIAVAFAGTSLTTRSIFTGSVHYCPLSRRVDQKATVQSDIYAVRIIYFSRDVDQVLADGRQIAVTIALQTFKKPLTSLNEERK